MKIERHHGLWMESPIGRGLIRITCIETSEDAANAHTAAHPDESLLAEVPPFCFIAKTKDKGLRVPREEDGSVSAKVMGYANHETAEVILSIDNTQRIQEHWRKRARQVWATTRFNEVLTRRQAVVQNLATVLQSEYEEARPSNVQNADIYSSLLATALGRVEWREVANHLLVKLEELDGLPAEGVSK